MTHEFDPGPPASLAGIFAACPPPSVPTAFWTDWGPVFYRGRLDDSARVLCIASDPGPTERIASRTLVGDAGQRVQGFLAKLGLTHSYLCLNAFPYALHPSQASNAETLLKEPGQRSWRNSLYDAVKSSALEAIVSFGANAKLAIGQWPGKPAGVPVIQVPHPSSRDAAKLLSEWKTAIATLRNSVTPDPDGDSSLPNYGSTFKESDYAPIPRRDLPFGVPGFLGDDSWGRHAHPRHNDAVSRPSPDDAHTLIWKAPKKT
jgi:Uracil DNA glycosylase superfamily